MLPVGVFVTTSHDRLTIKIVPLFKFSLQGIQKSSHGKFSIKIKIFLKNPCEGFCQSVLRETQNPNCDLL
jgi:hypothetical protein